MTEPAGDRQPYLDREWLKAHLAEERREADLLGEIREALFGMQDGIVSTLAVTSAVGGATADTFAVLVAGLASALGGVFSMGAGEYLSTKSQRELYEAQIEGEREEVRERPGEAAAEVAYMLEREGLPEPAAKRVAAELAREPEVLLRTMVEKELGIGVEEGRGALAGALVMGGSFGLASLLPIVPYLLLPVGTAFPASLVLCAATLFAIGALKTRWTRKSPLRSGIEVVALAAFAGIAGYLFGTVLPTLLGVAGVAP